MTPIKKEFLNSEALGAQCLTCHASDHGDDLEENSKTGTVDAPDRRHVDVNATLTSDHSVMAPRGRNSSSVDLQVIWNAMSSERRLDFIGCCPRPDRRSG